jgi:hypothetical protein
LRQIQLGEEVGSIRAAEVDDLNPPRQDRIGSINRLIQAIEEDTKGIHMETFTAVSRPILDHRTTSDHPTTLDRHTARRAMGFRVFSAI